MRRALSLFAAIAFVSPLTAQMRHTPASPAAGFGAAVTIVGDDILITRTAATIRMPTYPESGAVYVYRRASDGWSS